MIFAFTGKTGSGKTYKMISYVYKRWKQGEDIFTNTPLFFTDLQYQSTAQSILTHPELFNPLERTLFKIFGKEFKRGRIIFFEQITEILHVHDGVIVFDEAQVLFSARLWEALPAEFQYKLQQHRKHRLDLYCTTQNMGTIDITYRRLVQKWFHFKSLVEIKNKKTGRVFIGLYKMTEKDIDMLYNTIDDLKTPDIKNNYFLIHKFVRKLYDTMYDIGFRRFKTIWHSELDAKTLKKRKMFLILPKSMSLKDALGELSLSASLSKQSK